MFGYIAPRLDVLPEDRKLRYRSVYCGLCQELGRLSGRSGRILLSHDMTFLALLLSSLEEPEEREEEIRCAVHPLQKRTAVQSRAVSYAASMNLILMDLKCEDQIRDDHSRAASTERKWLRPAVNRLTAEYVPQAVSAREALEALWREESSGAPSPDRLGNLSGEMLGAVFVPDWAAPCWQPSLRALGEGLGRFVYWMDAWDDRDRDHRRRIFNPLDCLEPGTDRESFLREMLEMLLAEAVAVFEVLPLEKDLDLLRNVLYSGVWQRYEAKQNRGRKKEQAQ